MYWLRRRKLVVLMAVITLLVLAGCSSSGGNDSLTKGNSDLAVKIDLPGNGEVESQGLSFNLDSIKGIMTNQNDPTDIREETVQITEGDTTATLNFKELTNGASYDIVIKAKDTEGYDVYQGEESVAISGASTVKIGLSLLDAKNIIFNFINIPSDASSGKVIMLPENLNLEAALDIEQGKAKFGDLPADEYIAQIVLYNSSENEVLNQTTEPFEVLPGRVANINIDLNGVEHGGKLDIDLVWKTAPEAPTGLTVNYDEDNDTVDLAWDDTAQEYLIYRSTDINAPIPVMDNAITLNNYTDLVVEAGETYYYWVLAYDEDGLASDRSEAVNITIPEEEPDGVNIYYYQASGTPKIWVWEANDKNKVSEEMGYTWPGSAMEPDKDVNAPAGWYVFHIPEEYLSGENLEMHFNGDNSKVITRDPAVTGWYKDGNWSDEAPYKPTAPEIIVSKPAGKVRGDDKIIITIKKGVNSASCSFAGEDIAIDDEATIVVRDYLKNNGDTGTLKVEATNDIGTTTKELNYERDDSHVVPIEDIYGTLEPFAENAIYFVVTDRFVNGDTSNDYRDQGKDVGQGTWNRPIGSANIGYMGGDFKGIYDNADYITSMGFGAVWITPIVDNPDEAFTGGTPCQENSGAGADGGKTGYHGYWSDNFYQVDEHLPSDGLSFSEYTDKMRAKGLKTVLDIVLNHANPSFSMDQSQYDRSKFGKLYDENWNMVAYSNNQQSGHEWFNGNDQLAQLADFNPNSEAVFNYLSEAQLKWIREGADAFRIDTIKHLPMSWWARFVSKMREEKPGMYMFGEHFDISSGYMGEYQRQTGMDTLDFPCKYAMQSVFGGGGGYDGLLGYLHLDDDTMENPYTVATFYDNHDMARMNASDNGFIDAHNWLFTTRGVPVVYYGSEMGFQRGKGEHSGNRNYYGQENIEAAKNSPIYKALSKIGNIRKENVALQKGLQVNINISGDTATFIRVFQSKQDEIAQTAVVMLNKSGSSKSITVNKYLTAGTWVDAETGEEVSVAGSITADVPAHGFKIFLYNKPVENAELIELGKSLTRD